MKKSRFTETQIVSILKQADAGVPIKDICRQATVLGFPVVVRGCTDAVFTSQLRDRDAGFAFFQNRDDLRLGEPRLLHWTLPPGKILPEKSSCRCLPGGEAYGSARAPTVTCRTARLEVPIE